MVAMAIRSDASRNELKKKSDEIGGVYVLCSLTVNGYVCKVSIGKGFSLRMKYFVSSNVRPPCRYLTLCCTISNLLIPRRNK